MKIRIAKNERLISEEKAAGIANRRAHRLGIEPMVQKPRLCYKKMYFVKILALASRVPFKPKKTDYTMFYDSVTDTAGLTEYVPAAEETEVDEPYVLKPLYDLDAFNRRQDEFMERYLLRGYLLKRPELKIMGVEEVYLPYWVCRFPPNRKKDGLLINAATGRVNI